MDSVGACCDSSGLLPSPPVARTWVGMGTQRLLPDSDQAAHAVVAAFRVKAGRNPDKGLTDLIGELGH
jgi:hypothetical protein